MSKLVDLTQEDDSSPQPNIRQTRSKTRDQTASLAQNPPNPLLSSFPSSASNPFPIARLSLSLKSRLRAHNAHDTLLRKRKWLQTHTVPLPQRLSHNPVPATLVFAQEEAGTAVCVSPNGVLLTCAHCVAETSQELDLTREHWLMFASGDVVCAKTLGWDAQRDLALLIICEAADPTIAFPYIPLARAPPKLNTRLLCIGHPGSEDLEAPTAGTRTDYDTLVLSTGTFRGLAAGQDPQDNSDVGALQHTCWTYWGHSGAPLVERATGALVGVHSSWDEETGMRRGVGWEAVSAFLGEFEGRGDGGVGGWRWCVREEDGG